ncbi:hypothetical protein [Leisingera sp. F5]|uniref:hypothetical protein n=1 Tax=Leisingera sp. F5 TaxID=1813816 RepID=UPI000A8321E9|nr:hypothetical protein [Leisingera sp. F5]
MKATEFGLSLTLALSLPASLNAGVEAIVCRIAETCTIGNGCSKSNESFEFILIDGSRGAVRFNDKFVDTKHVGQTAFRWQQHGQENYLRFIDDTQFLLSRFSTSETLRAKSMTDEEQVEAEFQKLSGNHSETLANASLDYGSCN